jgi:DAACS family dicarboxylate/amino acid:cation (Na+ or H+) symporter
VGAYFATVMGALGLHALVYYPLSAWLVGGVSPRVFFREGAGAILTGFSINSSLGASPLTLKALSRMGVSDSSARLSACVGTNFNNDGITLYEAITALFIAQAAGMDLGVGQQISILLVVLAGSMGIAGIPNSGLIILTLVLKAARLPEEAVGVALPIVYSIDFVNARVRSAVNVMGDLQVAILLDAGRKVPTRRS